MDDYECCEYCDHAKWENEKLICELANEEVALNANCDNFEGDAGLARVGRGNY